MTPNASSASSLLPAMLFAAFVSGAAALSHELLWTRRLVDLLGGSSESSTRVLSVFFLGLSVGTWAAHQWQVGRFRPWQALGKIELSIAALTLPALLLPRLIEPLWPILGNQIVGSLSGLLIKLAISIIVILPPSIAIGMTFPVFIAGVYSARGTMVREGIWLYSVNTIGGVFGMMLATVVSLPLFGGTGAMLAAISLNLLVAMVCFGIDSQPSSVAEVTEVDSTASQSQMATRGDTTDTHRFPLLLMLGFFSGLGLLAAEIIGVQMMMLVAPISFYGPLVILATVVSLLAVAAPVAAKLSTNQAASSFMIRVAMGAGGIACLATPVLYHNVMRLIGLGETSSVLTFTVGLMFLTLLIFGPLFFSLGLLFPSLLAHAEWRWGQAFFRDRWTLLLVANGLGGLVGAELAYRVVLPVAGVHGSFGCLAVAYFAALGAWQFVESKYDFNVVAASLGSVAIAMGITSGWLLKLPQINPFLGFKVLSLETGADGLVAVVESERIGRAILVGNQYILGSTLGRFDQERQAHIPLLLHPSPENVAFIGLATGSTPGAALQHPAVKQITAIEISANVTKAADLFFQESNGGLIDNPRSSIIVEDGRTYLAASLNQFDVVVGDLFLPWGAGAGRSYSIEHFQAVRRALREDGIFCQWLPMYQLTDTQFESIYKTFNSVFPGAVAFRNSFSATQPALALIGSVSKPIDWNTIGIRCDQMASLRTVSDRSVTTIDGMRLLHIPFITVNPVSPINNLDNLYIELDASRQRITSDATSKYLHGSNWIRFLRQLRPASERTRLDGESTAAISKEDLVELSKTSLMLTEWNEAARQKHPLAEPLRRRVLERLSATLIPRNEAERLAWPGNVQMFDETLEDD